MNHIKSNFIILRDNRGSYSGRSSRDSATGGGYSRRPQGEVITEDRASNVLQGAADTDREKLEDKTRTIIEEYLQVWYCHILEERTWPFDGLSGLP